MKLATEIPAGKTPFILLIQFLSQTPQGSSFTLRFPDIAPDGPQLFWFENTESKLYAVLYRHLGTENIAVLHRETTKTNACTTIGRLAAGLTCTLFRICRLF